MRPGGAEKPCDSVSPFSAGAEDQRALDSVLRDPQCFRARVQLDPGAPRPGGLRDRRGPPVVSKYSALAFQPGCQSTVGVHGLEEYEGGYSRACGSREPAVTSGWHHYQHYNDS